MDGVVIVGLDVDNVLFPFSEGYAAWAEVIKGLKPGTLDPEPRHWSWYKDWGWTTEEFLDVYIEAIKNGFWLYPAARPGALYTAWWLNSRGHEIRYVSDRAVQGTRECITPTAAETLTSAWLEKEGFPQVYGNVIITGDKASVKTDIILDDKPENIDAVLDTRHAFPVLWEQSHNLDAPSYMTRASTWRSFRLRVEEMENPPVAVDPRSWDVV